MNTKNNLDKQPGIGIATIVDNNKKILLGKDTRKGKDVYGVPGGHWHSGESLKEGAIREVKEESGIKCKNVELISVYDFYRKDKKKSYVSIGMKAKYISGKVRDYQKEGRLSWKWYNPKDALGLNLYPPDRVLIRRYLSRSNK